MRRLHALIGMAAGILCGLVDQQVSAAPPYFYSSKGLTHEAMRRPWHQSYYHSQWGRPVPLVVPPVAGMHTEYSWGVTMNEMRPIYHHYSRSISGHTNSGVTQPISPSIQPAYFILHASTQHLHEVATHAVCGLASRQFGMPSRTAFFAISGMTTLPERFALGQKRHRNSIAFMAVGFNACNTKR